MTTDAAFWDGIAEKYAADPIEDMDGYLATLTRTKTYLKPTDRVLELGAGTSSTALELAPLVACYRATDISPEMVRIGREKAAAAGVSLEIEVADPAEPALQTRDQDVVLALNLIHLLPDVQAALTAMAGMLRPGGLLITKTGCLGDATLPRRLLYGAMIPVMTRLGKAPLYVRFLRGGDLLEMTRRAGFEVLEEASAPGTVPRHYIVARKVG